MRKIWTWLSAITVISLTYGFTFMGEEPSSINFWILGLIIANLALWAIIGPKVYKSLAAKV